ncbi:succinate dehydrogenase cytochrome b subunit [uncultured Microscilla sp.]|uniref:succinate dehydrogenase cytochrome b subunit n=1 Tax=uncultured Microscilla sp. TaxID=432653 RepID=UPI0026112B4F|nr:succinate dehydrogenase cytochrome b subunit [uncultured Microscilla sp.]
MSSTTQKIAKDKKGWFVDMMTSTIGRKVLMALTGIFLCLFLIIHLIGNLQLLKNDGGTAFNEYAHFMGSNPLIQTVSILNFTFIILHIVYSIILTRMNMQARPRKYAYSKPAANSNWRSRKMMALGSIILIFLIVHLVYFWGKMKLTHYGLVEEGVLVKKFGTTDQLHLYDLVNAAFSDIIMVVLYVVSMIALAFHLSHGFQSAFQTFGLNHVKYTPLIKTVGYAFAILIPLGYALIPIIMFATK